MNLTVLGAGAWGTALAVNACTRQSVLLWARDPDQAERMRLVRHNERYLGEAVFPAALRISADFDEAHAHARDGLIIVATPMAGLAGMLARLEAQSARPGVFWLCKGLEGRSGLMGHEMARTVCSTTRVGVLSGPSFAIEVARGQPTALVAASTDVALCEQAVVALHSDSLRVYTSNDPIGVEVGGAVKNVLAIATGIADGMRLGLNARAALITRGLAEMTRFGVSIGASPETFMGLSGLGDLVLTATGELSRNRRVGLLLAQGRPLATILNELGHVAEGVHSAPVVHQRAVAQGVDMPITAAVVQVLQGAKTPGQALEHLMGRQARPEIWGS